MISYSLSISDLYTGITHKILYFNRTSYCPVCNATGSDSYEHIHVLLFLLVLLIDMWSLSRYWLSRISYNLFITCWNILFNTMWVSLLSFLWLYSQCHGSGYKAFSNHTCPYCHGSGVFCFLFTLWIVANYWRFSWLESSTRNTLFLSICLS